jgi:carboxyl-terminal processing protease
MAGSRLLPVGALPIAISALVGGVMGRNVAASEDRLSEDERTFTAALNVIETRYVDKVESDRLVYGAISGMLQTLDAHSHFMDPRAYAQLRERQEGGNTGSASRFPRSTATSPSCRSSRALRRQQGIRRGDIIAKVDAKTRKAGQRRCVNGLRGKKGTTVDVYRSGPA